jgi:hypothetical protein
MDENEEKGRQNEEPPSSTASPATTAPTSSSSATPPSSTPSGKKAPLAKQASTGGEKKIPIHLKAVGDTPSLMKKNWDVGADKTVISYYNQILCCYCKKKNRSMKIVLF